jgi:hypothetical protein
LPPATWWPKTKRKAIETMKNPEKGEKKTLCE